eukprot:scaffold48185_cov39-Phaeocystis_antarctica.AAC.2
MASQLSRITSLGASNEVHLVRVGAGGATRCAPPHTYHGCAAHHVLRVLTSSYRTLLRVYLLLARCASPHTYHGCITYHVRVIAYGLYGADARYTVGVLRNAQLAPLVYPGWKVLSEE